MRFPYVVLLSACALTLVLPLLAQSPNGVLNGQVLDSSNHFAENLPMNGRSFQTLIELTPGVGLHEWLLSEGCIHVAMESTGVYWKPIYAILEGALEIVVANAEPQNLRIRVKNSQIASFEWWDDVALSVMRFLSVKGRLSSLESSTF